MGRSTIVVIWLALAALAFRPIGLVERLADLCFEPARQLGRIALPLSWFSSVHASSDGESRARVRELLIAEQQEAQPADASLVARRGLVHAQVIDRSQERADLVVVRFPPEASVLPGMPVVCGDVYVGSVLEVGRAASGALARGEARVELVTASHARVGARAGELELVVGGLARAEHSGGHSRLLAVRALQSTPGAERELRVHEDAAAGGEWSTLAEGYRLGTLVPLELGTRRAWAVEPVLDYSGGFSQVFVLCPPERAPAGELLAQDPFDAAAWIPVRATLDGMLSPWSETRQLLGGSRTGLREGAAVARGPEFVGRISHAGLFSSEVECLGNPGFRLLVLASVEDRYGPLHLGRVLSLGCDVSRSLVYLAWEESAELARELGQHARSAQLYTSSGERGIPPGLYLGSAELPVGEGAHTLVLRRPAAGRFGTALEAWTGERLGGEEP
ncbi:MAG: hypothetical protein IPJ19_01490 [Planctomycetes bacterium]|nr:hypothetical protein [Planctomycetota bacterium]